MGSSLQFADVPTAAIGMRSRDMRHKWSFRRRPATAAPAPTERPGRSRAEHESKALEWESERWKRQVEAEARHRLKRNVRDIGARRS